MTVLPYSSAELIRLLAGWSESSELYISNKQHRSFLDVYLAELQTKTIVLEPQYVDKDYLYDFAGYYVSCFHNYRRITSRLHFFSHEFGQEAFTALLAQQDGPLTEEALQSSYLGFIVVKPLPKTIIGRTCLRTYSTENGKRDFPILQNYPVNLAGLTLCVKSLAFQEQDSVAAACATSALWSCFHATGKYFHHAILSPTEITKAATVSLPDQEIPNTRIFPNKGLSATQMANAITAVGLEPQILSASSQHLVKSTIYAYLKGQVPVLLGFSLLDYDAAKTQQVNYGRHAVAVSGYSMEDGDLVPHGSTGLQLRASRMQKLYVHDDQLGPFARMKFITLPATHFGSGDENATIDLLSTEWRSSHGSAAVVGGPLLMVLPLYKKIRIPFQLIHDMTLELDQFVEMVRAVHLPDMGRLEWDIYLTTGSDFKKSLRADNGASLGDDLLGVLTASLPRFAWRVTATSGGEKACDFLFDATGIEQSVLLLFMKVYTVELFAILAALADAAHSNTIQPGAPQVLHILSAIHDPTSVTSAGSAPIILRPA